MSEDKKTQTGSTSEPAAGRIALGAIPGAVPPTDESSSKVKTSYIAETADPLLGASIAGRYKIIRRLGEGGMGSVYLAQHTVLEKQVALKVLHGEFARKPELVERFMQEAKAASRIQHENVIDISDFGATPEGLVFFAMELLQGHDLHDEIMRAKIQGKLLPWSRTKKIFLQVCAALSAAHARGIVHRDLKPENVYLVDFLGDPDFVKLLDFGIAKVTDVSGNEEGARKLTKTGMLFGTPEYMSPEQARGEKVDQRVDIYAMGCILFQLVTNRVPFEAENFMGVLSQHLTEDPPQIPPEVFDQISAPRELAEVIDKALIKDRNVRYQTIDELAADIRRVCGDIPGAKTAKPRAASVPAPSETTRMRPPTDKAPVRAASQPVAPRADSEPPTPARAVSEPAVHARAASEAAAQPTGRTRTQWTGKLQIPEATPQLPLAPRSKAPLVLGVLVVAGAGTAAALYSLGYLTPEEEGSGVPVAAVVTPDAAIAAVTPDAAPPPELPPPPPPEPALPAMVEIVFDSTPKGALVVDASDPKSTFGKTPTTFTLPGSETPRRFKFVLKGYGESTVELVPNREKIEFKQDLIKGPTKKDAAVTRVPDPVKKPDVAAGSATKPDATKPAGTKPDITKPDTTAKAGSAKPDTTTKPDATKPEGSATKPEGSATKPEGSATKPPDKPKEDCPDDEMPCLKVMPPGAK